MSRLFLPSYDDLSTLGRNRGSGAALPTTDLRRGDTFGYTPTGTAGNHLVVYSGTAWRYPAHKIMVADAAERNALTLTYAGLLAEQLDTGVIYRHDGTRWMPPETDWRRASIKLTSDLASYTTSQADILIGTAAGAWTVEYDAGPAGSANAMYDTANPGRLTARKAGWYGARLTVASLGGTAGAAAVARLARNAAGSASPGNAVKSAHYVITSECFVEVIIPGIFLNAGDYLNSTYWSATAAALTIKADLNHTLTRMTLDYLNPAAPSTPAS